MLKDIAQQFFGYGYYEEYTEYRSVRNPANAAKPFQFGPMLVCDRNVFLLVIDSELSIISTLLQNFTAAFPKYCHRTLIPIFMSAIIQPDQVSYLTEQGIYAVALDEETMELLNFDELQGR